MINTKKISYHLRKYFLPVLLMIGTLALLSSCSGVHSLTGSRNAPHSLFTSSGNHKDKKKSPVKYTASTQSGNVPQVNSNTNSSLQEERIDPTTYNQPVVSSSEPPKGSAQIPDNFKNGFKANKSKRKKLQEESLLVKSGNSEPVSRQEKANENEIKLSSLVPGNVLMKAFLISLVSVITTLILILIYYEIIKAYSQQ